MWRFDATRMTGNGIDFSQMLFPVNLSFSLKDSFFDNDCFRHNPYTFWRDSLGACIYAQKTDVAYIFMVKHNYNPYPLTSRITTAIMQNRIRSIRWCFACSWSVQGTTSTTRASKKAWCVYVFFMLHYFTHGLWIITSGVRALKNASSLSCIYSCPGEAREPWKHGREDSGGGQTEGAKWAWRSPCQFKKPFKGPRLRGMEN